MLTHVVLLQPKPETTEEQITTALDHVKALQEAISGIIDIQAGRNMSNYKGATLKPIAIMGGDQRKREIPGVKTEQAKNRRAAQEGTL